MTPVAPDQSQHPRGSLSNSISNLVVGVLNEYTGRGPTRARTYMQDDLISVVLRDTLTRGEQSLVAGGYAERVLDTRHMYQRTMRKDIIAGVEELTGRRVIAFLSDHHINPDIAIENILLEPADQTPEDNGATKAVG